jgi:hypothetical protein
MPSFITSFHAALHGFRDFQQTSRIQYLLGIEISLGFLGNTANQQAGYYTFANRNVVHQLPAEYMPIRSLSRSRRLR